MTRIALALGLVALLAVPAFAEEPAKLSLDDLVQTLLKTEDRKVQADLVRDILALEPALDEVQALLAKGRTYDAEVETGWQKRVNHCIDGVDRNYLLFVPEGYTPEKRYRLVVDMHGGVSGPRPWTHEELERMKFFWAEHAAEHGYFLALPTGQTRAEWWTRIGARNVLDIVRTVKRDFNIDENRVIATGFSDGASGSFYLALTRTTPFAGFLPLNGHLAVTQARGLQTHLLNLLNKPLYVVNTEKDSLYPSASVTPIIDALRPLGAKLVWRDIPEFTHNPMYLPNERPAIWEWMQDVERGPHPTRAVWQGAGMAPRRVHWLNVTHLEAVGNDEEFEDPNPEMPVGRVLIGVNIDQAFEGPGVKVTNVTDDSPASAAGLQPGDVIVGMDDVDIEGLDDLRRVLGAKSFGDDFEIHYKRGEEIHHEKGSFPEAKPRRAFRRPQPWSAVDATVKDNVFEVKVARVGHFDLFLSDQLIDFAKPIVVKVNGETVHEAVVKPDLAFLLEQAAWDEDRTMLYQAKLRVEVPRKDAP